MIKTTNTATKVAAAAAGFAMALSVIAPVAHASALTSSQVQAIISLLQSFGADSTTIANVQASLTGGTPTGGSTGGSTSSYTFTRDLTVGSKGADVTALQNWLVAQGYLKVAATGYFGPATKAAVAAWQASAGISPAAGYVGPKSRMVLNGSSSGSGSTGGTVPIGSGNGLKVSLAATSPNNTALVQGQGIGDLAEFTFANPTASPISVTGLTFRRTGVSNDSALNNVYLYNGVNRITDSAGVSAGQFSFSNPSGIFTVPAGGSMTIAVRADIAGATAGQVIGAQLVSVSSSGTLDSTVSFPISSGYQTVAAATLATVDFNASTLPTGNVSISPQAAYPVWQNTVTVSTNPVMLRSMKFTNLGSIDSSYVQNLRLYVDGTQVGATVPTLASDRTVTFDLSASPVSLSQQGHVIKLIADLTGGSSRTAQFSIQRSSDAMFVDSQLGQPVTPTKNGGSSFGSVSSGGTITIASVTGSSGVSVSLDPSSPTNNVPVGGTNVKLASYDFLASGEPVKVNDLYLEAQTTQGGGLANGKIFVNGQQVGSTKNIAEGTGGTQTGTDFSLGSSLILPAGQTVKVDIYADMKTSTSTNLISGRTAKIWIDAGSSNAQGQSSLNSANVPASSTAGNTITVQSSSLAAAMSTGYGNQTVIAGAQNAELGSFSLSTGQTEGVTVNTITLDLSSANAASITNLTLKDASTGTTLGTVVTTPSTSNAFSVNVDIPANSSKTFNVYGNILSGVNNGPIVLTLDTATAGTGDMTGTATSPSSGPTLQTITVGSGQLSVARGPNDPVSANILMGTAAQKLMDLKFTTQNSSYTVNNIAILIPNGQASSVASVTINGQTQPVNLTSTSLPYATATFTGLGIAIPANSTADVLVYGQINTLTQQTGISGTGINAVFDGGGTNGANNDFKASNSAGTQLTNVNSSGTGTSGPTLASGGTEIVRQSVPYVTVPNAGSTYNAVTSPLYRFTIAADNAGPIEWTKMTFNIATTSATVTNVYLVDEAAPGVNLLDNTTSSASTTASTITVDLTKNATQPRYRSIAAGASNAHTYDLLGTVAGFTTGSTISISLAQDTTSVANGTASATASGNNFVWSDLSAQPHTSPAVGVTSSADYTNGYLVTNFTTTSVSYSK